MGGLHHLISRGVEVAYQQAGKVEKLEVELPEWVPVLLVATVIFYAFIHIAITYAFGILVPTLTMIEAPTTTPIVRATEAYHDDETPDAPLLSREEKESHRTKLDEEVMILNHKPITSKLKTTFRHLRAQTGSKKAHLRGIGGFIVYNIAKIWGIGFVRAIVPLRLCAHLAEIPVAGALCLLSTAWIQQMVAMPGMSYFQRVSELSRAGVFKKLFLSVMAVEIVELAAFMGHHQLSALLSAATDDSNVAARVIGTVIIALILWASIIFVVIPLNIGLIRLQASYLSDETATVIPIDRTLGNAETKNLKSAWKSFSPQGCRLLVKNCIKYILIEVFMSLTLLLTIAVQLYIAFGSDALKIVRKQAEKAHDQLL